MCFSKDESANIYLYFAGSKDILGQRICEFLLAPDGDEELGEEEEEEEDESEKASEEEESESEDEKAKKKRGRGGANAKKGRDEKVSKAGRPRRATAGRGKGTKGTYSKTFFSKLK